MEGSGARESPAGAVDALDAELRRLARRAERVQIVVGLVLLLLVAGVVFLGFAAFIEWRLRQLLAALHARPIRIDSVRLQTRRSGPMGLTAVTTVFAVVGFRLEGGAARTLHLQGRADDLARLVRTMRDAVPGLRVDDPESVQAIVV